MGIRMTDKKATTKRTGTRVSAKSKSPKELATERGEPWVGIISVELDPDNIGNGAFELDWNDLFLAKLVRAGYQGKDDAQIVDQWFQTICRNVIMETFEQYEANSGNKDSLQIQRKNIGGGRTEIS
jgi:hypothetical protein